MSGSFLVIGRLSTCQPTDWNRLSIVNFYRIRDIPVSSHLHVLLSHLQATLAVQTYPGISSLEEIRAHMEENPCQRLNIAALAKEMGMAERSFARLFKKHVGQSPKRYQIQQRLLHARFLVEETDDPLHHIADQLGYADPFVFSKQFKTMFGCAPTALRTADKRLPT